MCLCVVYIKVMLQHQNEFVSDSSLSLHLCYLAIQNSSGILEYLANRISHGSLPLNALPFPYFLLSVLLLSLFFVASCIVWKVVIFTCTVYFYTETAYTLEWNLMQVKFHVFAYIKHNHFSWEWVGSQSSKKDHRPATLGLARQQTTRYMNFLCVLFLQSCSSPKNSLCKWITVGEYFHEKRENYQPL